MAESGKPVTSGAASVCVGVVMGSSSDWEVMRHAVAVLEEFGVPHEARVVSAHRMPNEMFQYAETARARGLRAIVAGAGGAAHLPGMLAAKTIVPVFGVPVPSRYLRGEDSLLSIVQMPRGVPVATFAIGEAGAANAALHAIATLATTDPALLRGLKRFVPRKMLRRAAWCCRHQASERTHPTAARAPQLARASGWRPARPNVHAGRAGIGLSRVRPRS